MREWRCVACGGKFPEDPSLWCCSCGGPLWLDFEPARINPQRIARRPADQWRYREALPLVNWHDRVSLGEGMTPLVPAVHRKIHYLAKLDFLMPSGSFKDRGSSLLLSFLSHSGIREIVEDSSGNAGASVACYAARAHIRATIFVPSHASPSKIRSIEGFGAKAVKIRGTRDDVTVAVRVAARRACYASHVWNPYFFHGTKTCAYEIVEQLGWTAPDWIVLPSGSGTMLLGLHAGFKEMAAQSLIDRMPRIAVAQARNVNPLERAVAGKKPRTPRPTVAEGVAVARPPRLGSMKEALGEMQGRVYSVKESRVLPAMHALWEAGIYVEPTSALAIAALEDLAEAEPVDGKKVVVIMTGSGLKYAGKSGTDTGAGNK